jgi:RNA methyltransferase, TrmH family
MVDAEITSIRSPRVKAARQLAKRSFRQGARSFLAEGPQAVREALGMREISDAGPTHCGTVTLGAIGSSGARGSDGTGGSIGSGGPRGAGAAAGPGGGAGGAGGPVVAELFVTGAAWSRYAELATEAAGQGAAVHAVSGEVMAELAQTVTPQGVLAVCRFVDVPLEQLVAVAPRLVALLANVRDPGNAGTVLRTADAAGADGVIFSAASVDPYNSKCVRASAGSLFHLPVVVGPPLRQAAAALSRAGVRILAAEGSAPLELDELESEGGLRRPTAWLFGNEAWGLPGDLLALADEAVAVPIYGRAESLNLAAAAAVCLYASARAQRISPPPGRRPV